MNRHRLRLVNETHYRTNGNWTSKHITVVYARRGAVWGCAWRITVYHSLEWAELVEQGWVTSHVYHDQLFGTVAVMLREREP